jgi:uncharacterized membrane protein
MRQQDHRRRERSRGFVLVTVGVGAIALVGMLGLSMDIGRMYVVKSETQAFADSAAVRAALELDGTTTGITRARTAAQTDSRNKWDLGSNSFASSNVTVTFATSLNGTYSSNPNPATNYTYAKVNVVSPMPLYFISAVVGQTSSSINAIAVGAQNP